MSAIHAKLCVCICTYKRPHLLQQELLDLFTQTTHPARLVIIDGDRDSSAVLDMLRALDFPIGWRVTYVLSNHSNLSFQRYLGWLTIQDHGYDYLLYFDDDLRLPQTDTIEKLLIPFTDVNEPNVVGVTALTQAQGWGNFNDPAIVQDSGSAPNSLIKLIGASRNIAPGGISSIGNRLYPAANEADFAEVNWLQGRVMAYRLAAMTQATFSEDLFALDEIRCGLGEDTFLSRRVGAQGRLLISMNTHIDHPDEDTPKSYPVKAYKLAYARAYSRRFLNDHYRVNEPPQLADRIDLIKSYVGVSFLTWVNAIAKLSAAHIAYARGFTAGAWRGLTQKPTSRNLTPNVDWWGDAERAAANAVEVTSRQVSTPKPHNE